MGTTLTYTPKSINNFNSTDNQPARNHSYGKAQNHPSYGSQNNLQSRTTDLYSQNRSKQDSIPGEVNPPPSTFKKSRDPAPTVTSHKPVPAKTLLDLQSENPFGKEKLQNIYNRESKPNPPSRSEVSKEDSSDNLRPNSKQNAYPSSRGHKDNNSQAKVQSRETSAAHLRQKYSIPSPLTFENAFKPSVNSIKIKDRPETLENISESPTFKQPSVTHKPRGHNGANNYPQNNRPRIQEQIASSPNLQKPPISGNIKQGAVQTINA
jgi:hypothetical protein